DTRERRWILGLIKSKVKVGFNLRRNQQASALIETQPPISSRIRSQLSRFAGGIDVPDTAAAGQFDRGDQPAALIRKGSDIAAVKKLFWRQFSLLSCLDVDAHETELIRGGPRLPGREGDRFSIG